MNKDLINYRFLVPRDNYTKDYLEDNYRDSWNTSDGSPFCSIDEGALFPLDLIKELPEYLKFDIYEISDRFIDTSDFITAFWDGDVENDDFIIDGVRR